MICIKQNFLYLLIFWIDKSHVQSCAGHVFQRGKKTNKRNSREVASDQVMGMINGIKRAHDIERLSLRFVSSVYYKIMVLIIFLMPPNEALMMVHAKNPFNNFLVSYFLSKKIIKIGPTWRFHLKILEGIEASTSLSRIT